MLTEAGEETEIVDLSRTDVSDAVRKAFYYDRVILACATYDGGIFPCMEEFLSHLKSKNYQKRKFGLIENGSWGPMAAKIMRQMLESMKEIEIVEPVVTIRSAMNAASAAKMQELAAAMQ